MKERSTRGSPPKAERIDASRQWVCYLLIAVATLLVWSPTLTYEFVWDDQVLVVENQSIRSLRNIPSMVTSLESQTAQKDIPSYRPLRTAWYALLDALSGSGGPRPWLFHLSNLLWHTTAAMLLFSVASLLLDSLTGLSGPARRIAALLVAMGFALHPVNSEPVCWVKCLDDLMAGTLVLASALCLLKWKGERSRYLAALIFFILAMYGKESAVPFAAVVFFIAAGFHRMTWRKSAAVAAPFFAAALMFMLHRHFVMGRTSQYVPLSGTYGRTLLDMLPVALDYLRLVFGIPPFCIDYNYMVYEPVHRFFSAPVLGGVLTLTAAAVAAVWLWFKPKCRLVSFGLIWAGLFMLPVSNLVPMMQYMAERFLYVPLPGLLIALAAVLLQLPQPRLCALAATACVVIWCAASWNRMSIWRDDVTLFVRTSLEHPGIKRVEDNAVAAIFRLPQMKELFPDYIKNGSIRMGGPLTPKQAEPVINILSQAHGIFPTNQLVASALAFAYAKARQWPQAIGVAEASAHQHPDSADPWFNFAAILRASGESARAKEACAKALTISPDNASALRLQIGIDEQLKDYAGALVCANKLEGVEPTNSEIPGIIRQLQEKADATAKH